MWATLIGKYDVPGPSFAKAMEDKNAKLKKEIRFFMMSPADNPPTDTPDEPVEPEPPF